MYDSTSRKTNAIFKEVSAKLKRIRQLLKTKEGKKFVNKEVNKKWL